MRMMQHAIRLMPNLNRAVALIAFMILCVRCDTILATEQDGNDSQIIATLRAHCVKCHGANDELEGDVDLLRLDEDSLRADVELIQSLIDVLELEEMPPEDEPALNPQLRTSLVAELNAIMHEAIAKETIFARTPVRRMNRFQYNNAVIDLFDLQCTVFTLPERMMREHGNYFQPATGKMPDHVIVGSRPLGKSQLIERRLAGVAAFPQDLRAEHGFDNRGDHLSMSPLLMEAFLGLGESVTQSPDFNATNVGIWDKFFATPDSENDSRGEIRARLEPFLSKAFRRPIDATTLNRYTSFALQELVRGTDFTEVMKSIAGAAIASPRFLYLYDQASSSDTAETINDIELASRMSFFLWGSLPDETLLNLAAKGELHHEDVMNDQIGRMLQDRKLKRFCDSFPAQWLQLERIVSSVPNPDKYHKFYFAKFRVSMHMMLEPLLLFETVLIEDLPITQLIDSDFAYRSSVLQSGYGELASGEKVDSEGSNNPAQLRFYRVPVSDRRVGGVITNAAVMTMTSGPDRTQPITRGAWIATVIFNNPPDPPPANVPSLDEKPTEGEEHLTLRERLAIHRQRADCKGCHEQIDPLGFALENFDPVGVWRDQYANGRKVDMAGTLFRKHGFNNVVEFKDAILTEKDRFTRGLAGHLLSFALARELTAADRPALDKIAEATAADGYKMQTLLKQVMMSEPFLSKTSPK
ncbi:DUF1592 domain-containing protein [Rhodopirellula sp. ICT_H3.1]|uniref:DUF1592 domain-containing protein n=2 Tax=Aporhodopirellula aestuarii TaxID=2950107 RepID=A0ABT0UCX6_9BACT|nr:DUF1592 domain-containing protein [Aporhodopirellula aestuarii]